MLLVNWRLERLLSRLCWYSAPSEGYNATKLSVIGTEYVERTHCFTSLKPTNHVP